jgi:hypothetical protein
MKVAVGGKALRQQLGANDLAVLEDKAARGLMGEEKACDTGD